MHAPTPRCDNLCSSGERDAHDRGARPREAYNAVTDSVDASAARGLGAKVAFSDPERSTTYAELQARTCHFAKQLKALGFLATGEGR